MVLIAQSDGVTSDRLAADLADVEARFAAELLSDLPCVNHLVTHIERYRGKMLRPTLVLLSAMALRPQRAETDDPERTVATVVEMVHMATLVHDDILDEAEMRRRGTTINHLHGNEAAVMLGDYLISHAYHLCSTLSRPAISQVIADATNTVCEGELLQLTNRNNWSLDERTYFEIIRRKTASLCGTCCRLPALLAQTDAATADALYDYGEKLGIAFQIVDDVLDLLGDQKTVGKTLGRDLEKGKLTLPLIHYLATSPQAQRTQLLDLLARQSDSTLPEPERAAQVAKIRDLVTASQSVAYARRQAAKLIALAKASLTISLDASAIRLLLLDMADAVLTRQS
jgi:octaprenyl-diphosphate synthase